MKINKNTIITTDAASKHEFLKRNKWIDRLAVDGVELTYKMSANRASGIVFLYEDASGRLTYIKKSELIEHLNCC